MLKSSEMFYFLDNDDLSKLKENRSAFWDHCSLHENGDRIVSLTKRRNKFFEVSSRKSLIVLIPIVSDRNVFVDVIEHAFVAEMLEIKTFEMDFGKVRAGVLECELLNLIVQIKLIL